MDEAVKAGVPEVAARDFMFGHINENMLRWKPHFHFVERMFLGEDFIWSFQSLPCLTAICALATFCQVLKNPSKARAGGAITFARSILSHYQTKTCGLWSVFVESLIYGCTLME